MPEWMKLDARPLSAHGGQERARGGFAFALRHGVARGGQERVRRLHAAPQGSRSAAHRDHGSGGERTRHVGQRPRLLAGGAETLRSARAARGSQRHACDRPPRHPRTGRKPLAPKPRCTSTPGRWRNMSGRSRPPGKAVYPLPLYANAALRDPLKPGRARQLTRAAAPPTMCSPSGKWRHPRWMFWRRTSIMNNRRRVSEGARTLSSRRQSPVRARDGRRRQCALLLRGARPAGHRILAVRHGLHQDSQRG